MALELPGWLREALNFLGYEWPASNEDILNAWATAYSGVQGTVSGAHVQFTNGLQHIASNNSGPGVEAFQSYMTGGEAALHSLEKFGHGADVVGQVCQVCAQLVLGLKGVVIAQLAILAAAIAAAVASAGIGTAAAFAAREAAKRIIDGVIGEIVGIVLMGG